MGIRLLAVAFMISLVLFAPAASGKGKKKSALMAEAPFASRIGSNGQPFYLEAGYMPGHGLQSNEPIKLTLHGNGDYTYGLPGVLREDDWFPGMSLEVAEVRIVCSSNVHEVPLTAHVVFPDQTESDKGHLARVEIPCNFGLQQTRLALTNIKKLLIDKYDTQKVAKQSSSLANRCNEKQKSAECKNWQDLIESIFTGEIQKPLLSPATYCGISFNAGLEASDSASKKISKQAALQVAASEFDFDMNEKFDLRDQKASEDFNKKTQGALDKYLIGCSNSDAEVFNFEKCLSGIRRAKEMLSSYGIKYEDYCPIPSTIGCLLWIQLVTREREVHLNLARKSANDPKVNQQAMAKATDTQIRDYEKMFSQHPASVIDGQVSYVSPSFFGGSHCKSDRDCWRRLAAIDKALSQKLETMPSGCYRVKKISLVNGLPQIEFTSATDCSTF